MRETILDFPLHNFRRKPIRFVSGAVTPEYIYNDVVKPGYVLVITRLAIENQTSSFTSFRVGTFDGANFHLAEEQKSPAAATLYWTTDPIYLTEGERLRVEIRGATLNDIIMVYVDYFYRKL